MFIAATGSSRSDVLLSRRDVLAGIAGAVAAPALVSSEAMAQAKPVVNVTLPTPGSAGSIWRAAIAYYASLVWSWSWSKPKGIDCITTIVRTDFR